MKLFPSLCLLVTLTALAPAQTSMTVEQLVGFIKSSINQHEGDRKVAEVVKKIHLSNQLDVRTVESLQGMGAGSLTMAALRTLSVASASLPAAPAPAPKLSIAPIPAPSADEQKQILAAITENALNYSNGLPNFICMQVTRRYVDQAGGENFRLTDTIAERLSYFEHKEDYKVISVN